MFELYLSDVCAFRSVSWHKWHHIYDFHNNILTARSNLHIHLGLSFSSRTLNCSKEFILKVQIGPCNMRDEDSHAALIISQVC